MAISYDLDMATAMSAEEVAGALCDVGRSAGLFGVAAGAELVLGDGVVTTGGTWIRVGEEKVHDWPRSWDPVVGDLGILTTVWAFFRLGRGSSLLDQQDDMVRLVDGLLSRVGGDAVLHFQSEQIWLLRRGGELSLSDDDDLWSPHRLAAVAQPYRRASLAFSDE
ncbi:SitI3 family protein [Streptomyces natalensis]|uniref:Uncharacterized protein n=1 Tax=Streptomyces natalensis ATCC 27448 TaxID=1240678 RepID=A0A0D7CDF0_9ACTN|nr:SitI3 family protein [Streptomyces natalensis]KIZ14284.1 hypothetical protein SNA_34845 [Streptomyces natalensis ATCC 27448]